MFKRYHVCCGENYNLSEKRFLKKNLNKQKYNGFNLFYLHLDYIEKNLELKKNIKDFIKY